ncbi:IS4 family transposase [Rhizobium sp. CG5]|uniref:IS4 family transposase n=1 Tax=Rhizobium sp. CG5 TaxID=2726076 RepID=UPI0020338A2E|nr:IS4 family transposase [Rhizobium sp. CG5]MCM2473332.1 IS4 family transposase [Rhizobium sp. CG5]
MQHHNSVFHAVLKQVPWGVFDRLVRQHDADHRVRRLSTKSQFVALLYGQLSGAVSLRDIEIGLSSHWRGLYHLGAKSPARSTLSDANARRPAAVFEGLFSALAQGADRAARRKIGDAVRLVDATNIRLSANWAHFSAKSCAGKIHVVYDPDEASPVYAVVTAANVNDITPAQNMPVETAATYVFDLGYYDFAWWAELKAKGCRIVTRLKTHTPLQSIESRPVPEGGDILSDRIGHLNRRIGYGRPNPYVDPVREVMVRISTGKIIRIVTSDLDAPAQEIAALYKRRWQIELFFRWVKQTLRIRHFLGTSENAVRIQVMVALITYILLASLKKTQARIESPLAFARLVRANLMHRKTIQNLIEPPKKPPEDNAQISFDLRPT